MYIYIHTYIYIYYMYICISMCKYPYIIHAIYRSYAVIKCYTESSYIVCKFKTRVSWGNKEISQYIIYTFPLLYKGFVN